MTDLRYIHGLVLEKPSDYFDETQEAFYQFSFKKLGLFEDASEGKPKIASDLIVRCQLSHKEMQLIKDYIYPGKRLLVVGESLPFAGSNGSKKQGLVGAVYIYLIGIPWLGELNEIS